MYHYDWSYSESKHSVIVKMPEVYYVLTLLSLFEHQII